MPQPIQPIAPDAHGVLRFKPNAIVKFLLGSGGHSLNDLAMMNFSVEDREQFAQLIGYSLQGFRELDYVTKETYQAAAILAQTSWTEEQASAASGRERRTAQQIPVPCSKTDADLRELCEIYNADRPKDSSYVWFNFRTGLPVQIVGADYKGTSRKQIG